MKTISQVTELTGISTRTLQYYDEINLLKPSQVTPSGYGLYSDKNLEKLQQILFFKELDFKLKEIKEILQKPEFDLSEYIQALEQFKMESTENIIKYWGNIDNFNQFIEKIKSDELCKKLIEDMTIDVTSEHIQQIVKELVEFTKALKSYFHK